MEDSKTLRKIYESLEDIGAFDSNTDDDQSSASGPLSNIVGDVESMIPESESDVQVASDPASSLSTIMKGIKSIVSSMQSGENVEQITSGLHNIAQAVNELTSELGTIEECHGTEGMGPTLVDKDGAELQVYNNPEGDSFPARNGFVG